MNLQLRNVRALVTGSSRGLGYATARVLSQEGAIVVLNSRQQARIQLGASQLSDETGNAVYGLAGDVGIPGVAEELVNKAAELCGGLDILICNAGGPPPGAFETIEESAWQKAFDLSFMSNVRLIKAALPFLRKSKTGSVLTITSFSVKQPIANLILSNSIRAATIGLTKSLALELGKDGIRFNSILPGWTETERVTELMTARAKANGTTMEFEISRQAAESPLGRMATTSEFASAAVFIASPLASYLTGLMLPVDGGMLKGTF